MNSRSNSGQPGRQRNSNRTQTRLSQKQKWLLGGVISTLVVILIVMVYQSTRTTPARAAVAGEYRSKASGNWNSLATWERFDGTNWVAPATTPVTADNIITIQNTHTVTVTAAVSADQIVVESGGRINVNSGITFTIANGTGTDLTNNGTIGNSGTISLSASASITHAAASNYIHSQNGGTIPTATWNATSTCQVTGVTGTMPSQIIQNYGNLTWNCTGQTASFTFNSNISIQGTFTLSSTGANRLALTDNLTARTFTIGGNYVQSNGTFRITDGWATGTLTVTGSCSISGGELMGNNSIAGATVTVGGDLNVSGSGLLNLCSGSASATCNANGNVSLTGGTIRLGESSGNGTLNVTGNFTHSGGTLTELGSGTYSVIFKGTSQQNYISGGTVSNNVNYTVNNGAYLQMDATNTTLTGAGTFTLSAGGKLGIKATDGISASGATGHIRVTGTRTYNNGADYEFNGDAVQTTGNGLPSTTRNLTINNAAGIVLSASSGASGTLTFTEGNVTTNANVLTLGTSSSTLGTLVRTSGHVVGNFRRWLANAATSGIIFPVGTAGIYNGVTMSFTAAPAAGTITASFSNGFPGVYGLPISDAGDECSTIGSGWWTLTGANGFSGGTFDMSIIAEGFSGINDYTKLHLFRRPNNTQMWEANGTHVAPTGSASVPVINRSGMTGLGEIAITSNGSNPLPVKLLSFEVTEVKKAAVIKWSTSSENNSDYFNVERSADGNNYSFLKKVTAAGNSTMVKNYEVTDANPRPGTSYYRLIQVDRDGSKEVYGPKSFRAGTSSSTVLRELKASPNPFHSDLRLNFQSLVNGNIPLIISNQNGRKLYNSTLTIQEGSNDINLPLTSQLSPGTYIITIGEGSSKISTQVIKQ